MKINILMSTAIVAFALIVLSAPSEANSRLPVLCEFPPSSPLFSPSRDLSVLHEDLQFDCDSSGCKVSATYRINSKQQAKLKMSFISPSKHVEKVTVNGVDTLAGEVLVAKLMDYEGLYYKIKKQHDAIGELMEQSRRRIEQNSSSKNSKAEDDPEYLKLQERSEADYEEMDQVWKLHNQERDHHSHFAEMFGKLAELPNPQPQEDCSVPPDLSQPKGWEYYVACFLGEGNSPHDSDMFGSEQEWEMYQFNFDADFHPGENIMKISYQQPYSFSEVDVGFFSSPPLNHVSFLSYELWPLKEWSLAPGFILDITVRLHNPRYGFLYRKQLGLSVGSSSFKEKKFGNAGMYMLSSSLPSDTLESLPDDYLVYKKALQGDFKDRLYIDIFEQNH